MLNAITSPDIKSMNALISHLHHCPKWAGKTGWILYCECSFKALDSLSLVALPLPLSLRVLYQPSNLVRSSRL